MAEQGKDVEGMDIDLDELRAKVGFILWKYRAVIKFHFGPLVVNLDTSSMYFLCKILNSMVFGLMTKLLQSEKFFETGLNFFVRPNIIELKYLHRAGI